VIGATIAAAVACPGLIFLAATLERRFAARTDAVLASELRCHKLELELAESQAAVGSVERNQQELLVRIGHAIRTPANGFVGMADLLLDTPLDPIQLDYAECIRDSSNTLLATLNDIMSASAGTGPLLAAGAAAFSAADPVKPIALRLPPDPSVCRPRSRSGDLILLAEDSIVNQKVAVRMLERLNYRVRVVSDGRAAVSAWKRGDIDLILMDCEMPLLPGLEATREIRRLEGEMSRTPIVALTAHALDGIDHACHAAGMDDCLIKPIDSTRLEACLQRHLPDDDAQLPPVIWEARLRTSVT
jgi:CheY-like chemotaxis protein